MNDTQLQRIEEKAEQNISKVLEENGSAAEALNDLCFVMGGLDAINTIATNLNSGLIIKLQEIRDTHGYRKAGFTRFDNFMDEFPRSPMSYKRFNYIENIFKNLGSDVFDLTSSSGLSMRQQKLLGKGNVEIENGIVRVKTDDGSVEIEINNRRQWLESLTALADANTEKAAKITRQKEKLDKHDEKVRELNDEIDQVKASKAAEIGKDPHSMALANLCFAFAALREEISKLTVVDAEARCMNVLEILAGQMSDTSRAYGGSSDWAAEVRTGSGSDRVSGADLSDDEWIANALDSIDDDAGDNDAELAASM